MAVKVDTSSKKTAKRPVARIVASKIFDAEYAKLNTSQKQAVDAIEGPVMVVAGPGTGKTQVLGMRTANILKKTQMRPSNILCLTFSTSGAKAMRERLRLTIGSDAYGITVNTIHGFCNDVIQLNPSVFEDFRALEQVSDIERLRIIRRLLKGLKPGSVLGKPSIDRDRSADILSRIQEMKREKIEPTVLREHLETFKEEIKTSKSGKQRDPNSAAYKKDQRLIKQFAEFIDLYEGYNAALKESHRYDYEDMILYTIQALKDNEWLLMSLQERYQYVLIDEFQDTNGAQYKFIELLTDYVNLDHEPNLFVVGDDDQAIYRFQGANIGNVLSFTERFPNSKVITLTDNYRSSQPILDSASNVIRENEERLINRLDGIEKNLKAKIEKGTERLQFLRYPSTEIERSAIAGILKKANDDGTPWSEMAVLCRRNEEVMDMAEVLASADVPAVITAKKDLLASSSVLQTIALLRAVCMVDSDSVFSSAISIPAFKCHPADLGSLWVNVRKTEPHQTVREYVLNNETSDEIKAASNLIEELIGLQESVTLLDLIEKTLRQSGLLPEKEDPSADPNSLASLHAFYEYVKTRCYEQKGLDLRGLLADLDQYLEEPNLKLQYEVPHLVSEGVQLMTAHGAKGLEFSLVVMAHVRFRNWGNRSNASRLSLPDHLIYEIDQEVEKRSAQEDERRLFYVASTRAKQKLFLTFSETYRSGEQVREAQVSSFVAEAGQGIEEIEISPSSLPAPVETLYRPEISIDDSFKAFLKERIEDFELSVTALNAFLKDPQEFLWEQLLQQPKAKRAHLAYGSAMHWALEQMNVAWKEGKEFTIENLIKQFSEAMKNREIFTDHEREHYIHIGEMVLKRYFDQVKDQKLIIMNAEKTIKGHLDDIPIKGKVDRIDLFTPTSQECRIVDYKTGRPKFTVEAVRKEEGLFRQLVFYKLLCDVSPSFIHEARLFTLDFIGNEDTDRKLIELEITGQEVEELKGVIKAVWKKITELDFTPIE